MNIKRSPKLARTLRKLKKKDPTLFRQVQNKINQIASLDEATIHHFKNLRHELSEYKRVKVGSFVLFFKLEGDIVAFDKLVHHDDAY